MKNFDSSDQLRTCQQHQDIIRSSSLTLAVSLSQSAVCKPLTFYSSVVSSRSYQHAGLT